MRSPSIKVQLIVFLTSFAVYLSFIDKNALFLLTFLVAVSSAVVTDSIITYIKEEKLAIRDSSIISGLIIGYVLSDIEPWWIFILASVLAIGSKYLIRINKKHIFNPACFGIFSTVILLGVSTQWKGTNLWYIFIPAGCYFVYKIRKIEVVIGYMAAFLALFGTQALIQKTPLFDILRYQNYFFIFVMLIEPKTTPIKAVGKIAFGMAVAALSFILVKSGAAFDAELCSLLVLNILSPLLNKLPW